MKIKVRVKIDTSGLRKFRDRIVRLVHHKPEGDQALQDLDRTWMQRIRQFVADHFTKSSGGGGDWPDLAESTKRARARTEEANAIRATVGLKPLKGHNRAAQAAPRGRQKSISATPSTFPILDVTGELRDAVSSLDDGTSIIQEAHPLLGYGGLIFAGGETHGGIATAELAAIHQKGNDRLPAREIIPELDDEVQEVMIEDLRHTVHRIAEETRIR